MVKSETETQKMRKAGETHFWRILGKFKKNWRQIWWEKTPHVICERPLRSLGLIVWKTKPNQNYQRNSWFKIKLHFLVEWVWSKPVNFLALIFPQTPNVHWIKIRLSVIRFEINTPTYTVVSSLHKQNQFSLLGFILHFQHRDGSFADNARRTVGNGNATWKPFKKRKWIADAVGWVCVLCIGFPQPFAANVLENLLKCFPRIFIGNEVKHDLTRIIYFQVVCFTPRLEWKFSFSDGF